MIKHPLRNALWACGLTATIPACAAGVAGSEDDVLRVGSRSQALQGGLSEDTLEAMAIGLDDEYRSRAAYNAVLDKFGTVLPFANIVQAEQRHIDMLLSLYDRYGVEAPDDEWAGRVGAPSTVLEACRQGVQSEIDNATLYDQLFEQVDNDEVLAVMERLRDASQNNHLPAFQRCVQRESGGGGGGPGSAGGSGQGRGRRWRGGRG